MRSVLRKPLNWERDKLPATREALDPAQGRLRSGDREFPLLRAAPGGSRAEAERRWDERGRRSQSPGQVRRVPHERGAPPSPRRGCLGAWHTRVSPSGVLAFPPHHFPPRGTLRGRPGTSSAERGGRHHLPWYSWPGT